MDQLIDVWRVSTGQKYENQIPASWIGAGLAPGLTATDPNEPQPAGPAQPTETPTLEEV
jgi:hypothetical protein